jgi:HSP20 family protein
VEIYAFAPGLDPASIDVQLVKGVLTIVGERKSDLSDKDEQTSLLSMNASRAASAVW